MYPMIPPEQRPNHEAAKGGQDERMDDEPLLVRIVGFTTEERAHLAKNFLEEQGIQSVITNDDNAIALEVHKTHAKKASRLLKGKIR